MLLEHLLDGLRVVGSKSHEDDHAGVIEDKCQALCFHEDVDHRGNNQPDEKHE